LTAFSGNSNWAFLEPGPADRKLALVKFGQRVVAPGSTIRTDGARQLRRFLLRFLQQATNTDPSPLKDLVIPHGADPRQRVS
jgi:hypothetical protein